MGLSHFAYPLPPWKRYVTFERPFEALKKIEVTFLSLASTLACVVLGVVLGVVVVTLLVLDLGTASLDSLHPIRYH